MEEGFAQPPCGQTPWDAGPGPIVYLGNFFPVVVTQFTPIRGGVVNTMVVGERPAVSGTWVAFISNEAQANLDLNGSGGLPSPTENALRILDLDSGEFILTHVGVAPPDAVPAGGCAIVGATPGTMAGILVSYIARETTVDVNCDTDLLDFYAVVQLVQGPFANYNLQTWGLGGPQSPGAVSGFRRVQMSGTMMVLEQGDPTPGLPLLAAPLPMAVLDISGFFSPYLEALLAGSPLMPDPYPQFSYAVSGFNPSISASGPLGFPQSDMLAYEQSEVQLGDSNADGDTCDRVLTIRTLGTSSSTPAPCFPTINATCNSPTIFAPCILGVGNRPSVRPDAAFGNRIGFDILAPGLQAGAGPNCAPFPQPNSGIAGRGDAATCPVGLSTASMACEDVSVAGLVYSFVVRENAMNVNVDMNGDTFIDPGVIFWTPQSAFFSVRTAVGPGRNPAAENAFSFVVQGSPDFDWGTLIVYTGDETFSSPDLNLDGDQGDFVILFYLQ
ncbi:MAG: hypothetical protein L0323_13095 [Planctomycetes bacterium]|nr:hypothetical protein [Planctomycetota bacterium]